MKKVRSEWQKKPIWEIAILLCFEQAGGTAEESRIYADIPAVKKLSARHLEDSGFGHRPKYVNQIRAHIADLREIGQLTSLGGGSYAITDEGRSRLQEWRKSHPK